MRLAPPLFLLALLVTILLSPARLLAASPTDDQAVSEKLISLERDSWVAWQHHDAKFFGDFLSEDHIELGTHGPGTKANVVAFVGSPVCKVESYSLGDIRFTRLSADSAVLVYRAEQKTTCGSMTVPSPVWVTSVFALRNGQWKNVLYEQVPLAPPPTPPKPSGT